MLSTSGRLARLRRETRSVMPSLPLGYIPEDRSSFAANDLGVRGGVAGAIQALHGSCV